MRSDVLAYAGLEFAQALIAGFGGAAHFRFYRQNPRQFLLVWGWAWVALAATRFFGAIGILLAHPTALLDPGIPAVNFVVQATSYLAMGYLISGAVSLLTGRPVTTLVLWAVLAAAAAAGAAAVLVPRGEESRFTVLFPVRTALGTVAALLVGSWLWWRFRNAPGIGGRATGYAIAGFALPLGGYMIAATQGEGLDPNRPINLLVLSGIAHTVMSAAMALAMIIWLYELEHDRGAAAELELRREIEARDRRLVQAERMESVGRLAGGIAHDFNNLLTVVKGNTAMVAKAVTAESPARGWLAEIAEAADRGAGLIHQLLALARRQPVAPVVFDLDALVERLDPILRRLLSDRATLRRQAAGHPCWVRADPTRIEQVILNLVANAKDAMPSGGSCTLSIQRTPGDGSTAGTVQLAVADTGSGIPEAIQGRVFEPFFTTKPAGQGNGLGLATAYGAIEQAGGHLTVSSRVGQGSTFTMSLPEAPAPA